MRTIFLTIFSVLCLFCSTHLSAQIENLFEKEAPDFHVAIVESNEMGTVELEIIFTHERTNKLEASVWMIDRGENRVGDGRKEIITTSLIPLENRVSSKINVTDLEPEHYYSFGIDYRKPSTLMANKFESKSIKEGYQYNYNAPVETVVTENKTPQTPLVETKTTSNPPAAIEKPKTCVPASIKLGFRANGFCEDGDMPAVLIQNSVDQKWEFLIETKTNGSDWRPILAGNKRLSANGTLLRTEPLCLLSSGTHQLRVLAWGENCRRPEIVELSNTVIIKNGIPSAEEVVQHSLPYAPPVAQLPDTCRVSGEAFLEGKYILGSLELDKYSPCGDFDPFVKIRYVHPGYRDINLDPIPLIQGEIVDFEILLDQEDLTRTIHPINVVTYIRENGQDNVLSAFWIRPEGEVQEVVAQNEPVIDLPAKDLTRKSPITNPTVTTTPANSQPTEQSLPADPILTEEPMLTDEISTISVNATDPNCTQLHDLQLVYDLKQSAKPLYISWLSPRCCQEEGCEYSIWSGNAPDELNLIMKGYKSGAVIRELLSPSSADHQYFEIVVNTSNGKRKAAYAVGEGPLYGIEEILDYHDRFTPQSSNTQEVLAQQASQQASASFSWDTDQPTQVAAPVEEITEKVAYISPRLAIDRFKPCQNRKIMQVNGDYPINVDDYLTIKYDYDRPGYEYTLYFQPEGSEKWYLAPGTRELNSQAEFELQMGLEHDGNYTMLLYKAEKGWGCLTTPLTNPLSLEVIE